jgi:hypothetical protein
MLNPAGEVLAAATTPVMPAVPSVVEDIPGWAFPSFFIVGPPRTGTSWLHQVLEKRAVLPDPVKETRFFDVHFHRGLPWYRAHYRQPANGIVGEVAPTYFASQAVRERLVQMAPGARIICIFRDPVERIFSHYRIKRAYGMIPWDFEDAVLRDSELVETNRYACHFKEWQRIFGSGQVTATLYDDLRDEPQTYVNRVADLVGMPRSTLTTAETRQVHGSGGMTLPRSYPLTRGATLTAEWCKARRLHSIVRLVKRSPLKNLFLGGGPPFAELPAKVAGRLYERFRSEVEELEAILNRDLSSWKSPRAARRLKLGEIA